MHQRGHEKTSRKIELGIKKQVAIFVFILHSDGCAIIFLNMWAFGDSLWVKENYRELMYFYEIM